MNTDALSKAIEIAGGQRGLANAINEHAPAAAKPLRQQNVWVWLNQTGKVPPEYCPAIEKLTKGEITCRQLRPDVYPPAIFECACKDDPSKAGAQ